MSVKQRNLLSRRYSRGRKFCNALCIFGWIWVLHLGVLFLIMPTLLENDLVGLIVGTMLFMLSIIKICRRVPLVTLYAFKDLSFGKKLRNVLSGFLFFNMMVAASIVYYANIYFSEFNSAAADGMFRPFDVMQARSIVQEDMGIFFQFTGRYLAWLLPIALYSILVTPLLLESVRKFFSKTWRFFLRYVTVYMVFQGILFLITASVGMISFSLAETTVDGNSLWYIFASYFHFSLEAPLEEVNAIAAGKMSLFSKTGTLVGSLTGAASYWVLSDMAAEHIWEEKKTPFYKRLLDLFHDRSTLLLIVMSVLCALSSIQVYGMISRGTAGIFSVLVCMVFIAAWLITLRLFVKETKPFSYIFTFAIMYFVEAVVIDPSINSTGLWEVTALTAAVRIVGFTFVAAMIEFFFRFMESFESNMGRTEEQREAVLAFTRGNIFKIVSWMAKAYHAGL